MTRPHGRLILGLGYLGQVVARRWLAEGATVYATTRSVARVEELERLGVRPIVWDVLSPPSDTLPEVDTVLWCVGFDRTVPGVSVRDVYVAGLQHTLDRMPNPGRFLLVSSTGVYGDSQGGWLDESTPPEPMDASGAACWDAEQLLMAAAQKRHFPAIVLRLAGLYGPGRLMNAEDLKNGRPVRSLPDAHVNLIHVQDAATVIDCARQRGVPGQTYIVSDGSPILRRKFYEEFARLVGAPTPHYDPAGGSRHRGDRRLRNRRMVEELRPALRFADFRAGLRDALGLPPDATVPANAS